MSAAEEQHQSQTQSRIPSFASLEEERAFWDTHDLTDYWDEFEPVELQSAETVRHVVSFEIDIATLSGIVEIARELGVEPLTLATEWLAERVRAERERG